MPEPNMTLASAERAAVDCGAYKQDARLTVGDLIAQLQQHDPNTLVLVNGYEGGFQAPEIFEATVELDWGGCYEGPWRNHDPREPAGAAEQAIIVSRGRDER